MTVVHVLVLTLAGALSLVVWDFDLNSDPTYLALGAAVIVGALITVPWRANGLPSSLLLVPLLAAQWRFGASAAPLVLIASALASAIRRASWAGLALSATRDLSAFGIAYLATRTVDQPELRTGLFALTFAVARLSLWVGATRAGLPATMDRGVDQPDLGLSLIVAPLGAVSVAAGMLLGDGGVLLALAGVLPILCIVAEWWRLRLARAEAEAERDRLGDAREVQEQLTYLITHEVRSPLTTVLGYCQLARAALAKKAEPREIEKHLNRIYNAGQAIERLTENLLRLSKVEGAGEERANERVDLSVLAHDVASEMEPLAEQRRQDLVLDLTEEPAMAWASPVLLREALSNLVSNAIKYTPEGGRVRVWVRPGPEPGTESLGVTDNGYGLSEVDRERLFTKFFRSEDPRVTRERGSGLGLALTQAIVQRMGGQILVDSKLDEGTTFRFQLTSASEGDQQE